MLFRKLYPLLYVAPTSSVSISTPTAYWNMEQATGATRTDICSTPADLVVNGTVTQVTGVISFAAQSGNTSGNRLKITSTPTKINPGSGSFSYAGWFKLSGTNSAVTTYGGFGTGWTLSRTNDGINETWTFTVYQTSKILQAVTRTQALFSGWTYVACVFNGSTIKLSLNAGTQGSTSASAPVAATTLDVAGITGVTGNIAVDELGWWKGTALSTTEITSLYNSGSGKTFNGSAWV